MRQSSVKEIEVNGKSSGREGWNWVAFNGLCENLQQCKLPEIYEGDPNEES